jgi:transcriptional regulator with XRE-family HTH domain
MPTPHRVSPGVKRTLIKLGRDLREARLRRRLSAVIVAERAGTSRPTLRRVEAGNPGVSMGVYASVIQAVGLLSNLSEIADISNDEVGRSLIGEQLTPRRAPRTSSS